MRSLIRRPSTRYSYVSAGTIDMFMSFSAPIDSLKAHIREPIGALKKPISANQRAKRGKCLDRDIENKTCTKSPDDRP